MTLLELMDRPVPVSDSHVLDPTEQRRLHRQSRLILQRLQQGPCSNRELSEIALKYTSRLHDIRSAGFDVRIVSRDYHTGCVMYALHV